MSEFVPRTTAPTTDNPCYYADNPFYQSGYGMPNCTAYAWGRFWEITGARPTLSTRNAENWYLNTSDGYERGSTPRLGAVICWRKGETGDSDDGGGHVAIVEKINSDGSILTSESGWQSDLFWTTTRNNSVGNWGAGSSYTFQGFIYAPGVGVDPEDGFKVPEWIAKNTYLTQAEMENNATIIHFYFMAKGWTRNAIAALLGNMEAESTISPQRWQSGNYGNMSGGFGLTQWTPATKYIDWAGADWETNHNKQLERIILEVNTPGLQWGAVAAYPESFKQFTVSTKSPYYLACAFVYNYEKSYVALYGTAEEKAAMEALRGGNANKWYEFICKLPDSPGSSGGSPGTMGTIPIWLLFKIRQRNGGKR